MADNNPHRRRLAHFKTCSGRWFYVPPFELMSGLLGSEDEYKERLVQMFARFVNSKSSLRKLLLADDNNCVV